MVMILLARHKGVKELISQSQETTATVPALVSNISREWLPIFKRIFNADVNVFRRNFSLHPMLFSSR